MTKNDQARELFRDALTGRISRRDLMVKGAALGMSATVLAALSQETMRSAVAQERDPIFTFYSWMTDLHPTLNDTANLIRPLASSRCHSCSSGAILRPAVSRPEGGIKNGVPFSTNAKT